MSKAELVERIEALSPDQLAALESYLKTLSSTNADTESPADARAERVLGTFDRIRERIRREHGVVDVSSSVRDQREARP